MFEENDFTFKYLATGSVSCANLFNSISFVLDCFYQPINGEILVKSSVHYILDELPV